jgi:hypothetical protein
LEDLGLDDMIMKMENTKIELESRLAQDRGKRQALVSTKVTFGIH